MADVLEIIEVAEMEVMLTLYTAKNVLDTVEEDVGTVEEINYVLYFPRVIYKNFPTFNTHPTINHCVPWAAMAINQQMIPTSPLLHHQDWRDVKTAPNAVIPYGTYTGGELVLWQYQCVVELLPGETRNAQEEYH